MSIVPLQSILLLVLTVALLFNKICAMEVDSLPSSRSWNALVGQAGDVAASEIRKQFPDYKVHIVKHVSGFLLSRIQFIDLLVLLEFDGNDGSEDGQGSNFCGRRRKSHSPTGCWVIEAL
jgi:hypothetical protein